MVETETSKTMERVSKYLELCSSESELNQTQENLYDLKTQVPPNLLRESRTAVNNSVKSITPIRIKNLDPRLCGKVLIRMAN